MTLPKVSIIIPTYHDKTKPYLDLCVDAIRNLDYPAELIDVSIISPTTYIPKYQGIKNLHHPNDNRSFAEAVNYGIKNSDQTSKHIFLLSDDTIPTANSLKNIVTTIGDLDHIAQGISNCDNGWQYQLHIPFKVGNDNYLLDKRYLTLDDFNNDDVKQLKFSNSLYPSGVIYPQTICFYAVLIPRSVINQIGFLDEQFRDGYEDSDYCQRAKNRSIRLVIVTDAIIFHFGGATTNDILTEEITAKNKKLFFDKWE